MPLDMVYQWFLVPREDERRGDHVWIQHLDNLDVHDPGLLHEGLLQLKPNQILVLEIKDLRTSSEKFK